MLPRINFYAVNPAAIDALTSVNKHVNSIDPALKLLLEIRVSQINGCAYCVDLHTRQARTAQETQQRLDGLAAWHHSPLFKARERAALAWAESLTAVASTHAPDDVYVELKVFFCDKEIVDITLIVSLMATWNRLGVGLRKLLQTVKEPQQLAKSFEYT
jgi:AhpD family alkylhydroperoxidase